MPSSAIPASGRAPGASARELGLPFGHRLGLKEYLRVRKCSVWFHRFKRAPLCTRQSVAYELHTSGRVSGRRRPPRFRRASRRRVSACCVWRLKALEHREVTDVRRREFRVEVFYRCRDDEVGQADAGPVAVPAAAHLTGAACDRLIELNPADRLEEPLRARALGASESSCHLDSCHFAARRNLCYRPHVRERSRICAENVDQDRSVEDDAHTRRRCSSSF